MKRILSAIVALSLIIVSVCLFSCGKNENGNTGDNVNEGVRNLTAITESGKIRIGVRAGLAGMNSYDDDAKTYKGFETDLAYIITESVFNCTYDEAKEKLEFVPVTSGGEEEFLAKGKADIIIAGCDINGDKSTVNFSDPYLITPLTLVYSDSKKLISINDLGGMKIGITEDSGDDTRLKTYIEKNNLKINIEFIQISPDALNPIIATAVSGKIKSADLTALGCDGIIVDGASLSFVDMSGVNTDSGIGYLELTDLGEKSYGIAAAKGSNMLIQKINSVLQRLETSKELDGLKIQWGLEKGAIDYSK